MSARTAAGQVNAAGALMAMVTAFRCLPAPAFRLERLWGCGGRAEATWGVTLALHDGLDQFEQWRAALGLDPSDVTAHLDADGPHWLEATGTWSGVPVQLIGHFHFTDPRPGAGAE